MSDIITGDDILGKEAVDPTGGILGVVTKLHINKDLKKMTGITIDMGFWKPDLYIGMNNIKRFGVDAVLLHKVPMDKLVGLRVLTMNGQIVGKVKEIEVKKNKIKELVVSVNKTLEPKGYIKISAGEIKNIGASILLKNDYKVKD
jgi:sporulation protein YlmC with PRC-barrel domain